MRHQLDEDFDSFRSLLFAPNAQITDSNVASQPGIPSVDMDYDRQIRELAFDQRAKAKDRTKTEDELALEQKEALEGAERRRMRRMLGEDGEGGDNLEDDFSGDGSFATIGSGLVRGIDQGVAQDDSEEEEDEDEGVGVDEDEETDCEDENSKVEEGSETSFGSEAGSTSGSEFDEITTNQKSAKLEPPGVRHDLPFTFPCPESHEEFLEIIGEIDDTDVPIVVQRIRTLHHPSLSPDNKVKLQVMPSFDSCELS